MSQSNVRGRLERQVLRSVAVAQPEPERSRWLRLFTDWDFAVRALRYLLRLPTPMTTEDRRVLEQVVFPHYRARTEFHSVLFVGCQWYTRHYQTAFFPQHDYWTLEPSERARKYGSRQHVVAPLERLDQFFPEGYFDLIVCNGVYGFGLDSLEQCESAFGACHSRLRAGGHFVFGWTDVPARTPVPLEQIASLTRFQRYEFPALGTWRYVTQTPYRHIYDFYYR